MSAETRPPDPPNPSNSYANRTRPSETELEDRNVLIVRIRKTNLPSSRHFDDEVCEAMCRIIGVKPIQDTVGCQCTMDRGDVIVEIWLKDHIQASKFSSDIWREICPGFDIVSAHPALSKEVTLLILDLPLNIKDSVVRDYVAKFGGKLAPQPPLLVKAKSGIWAGQPNGDRKYKVDFSGQIIPMGTYHFLGGRRVRFIYNGNTRTCGRCHQSPTGCPGNGIASRCRERDGTQVFIHEHMRNLNSLLDQTRSNLHPAQEVQVPDEDQHRPAFPPLSPPAVIVDETHDQSELTAFNAVQSAAAISPSAGPITVQPEAATPPGAGPIGQSERATPTSASLTVDQPLPSIPKLKDLARATVAGPVQPTPATNPAELTSTGTKPKIPGLQLSKSQRKREKAKERKRRQRANAANTTESEVLDSSTEDKMSQHMLNWINTSKKQSIRRGIESSDDENVDDTVDNEKDSFHDRVMRDSKSFLDIDNPFDVHSTENFKSVFANRLSMTPRASRPASSSASTPKRSRSPSPTGVGGIKSIRKE